MSFSCSVRGSVSRVSEWENHGTFHDVLQRDDRKHTLLVEDLGGAPIGTFVGGVVERATKPRPCVVDIHIHLLAAQGRVTTAQLLC